MLRIKCVAYLLTYLHFGTSKSNKCKCNLHAFVQVDLELHENVKEENVNTSFVYVSFDETKFIFILSAKLFFTHKMRNEFNSFLGDQFNLLLAIVPA